MLTFDVVGTLIDFETGIVGCLQEVARRSGMTPPERDVLLSAFGRAEDRQQREHSETPFTQMLAAIYADVAAEVGLPDEPSALRDSIPRWPAFPDAVETLAWLGERFRLVALTNSDNWALARMAATLGDPFHDAVTAEDVGVNKPSPRVFEYCRGRQSAHGYRLPDFLHVAQSQYHDIATAKSLGLAVCWIERRHDAPGWGATPPPARLTEPDHHFTSLAGLRRAMAA